jgi:uncharacterized membrane protein HdeD (DUF308 family)
VEASLSPEERAALEGVSRIWWLWTLFGILWFAIAVVILQFDQASINTVGVLIGLMFFVGSAQALIVSILTDTLKWLYALFGVLFAGAGILTLISPEDTFVAIADMLGFLFLLIGLFWVIQAFVAREVSDLWWIGLLAGVMMIVIAFWTGGQFFFEKQYVLLVFAGAWALLNGLTDIVRAFEIRKLGKLV